MKNPRLRLGTILLWCALLAANAEGGLDKPKVVSMKSTKEAVAKTVKTIEVALDAIGVAQEKVVCKSSVKASDLSDVQIDKWIKNLDDDAHPVREEGQSCLKKFLATNTSQIHALMARQMKTAVGAEQKFRLERLSSNIGEEVSCTLSQSKLLFYGGTERMPGILRKMTTRKEIGSQDLAPMKLAKCVSSDTAMRLRDFKWDEMNDPWNMTVARELVSVVLPDSKLGVSGPAWLSEADGYRFLSPSRGEFKAQCVSNPTSKCALDSPVMSKAAPPYLCRYACLCGNEKAVDHYEVSARIHNALLGAANLRDFEDRELCPKICKGEGKEPAPDTVWVPISHPSQPCSEDTGDVADHRKISVSYSLAGKFEEKGGTDERDESSGLQFQKTLKPVHGH